MKEIEGFKGYHITKDGRVWSDKTKRYLRTTKCGSGYFMVGLSNSGSVKPMSIHRLVAKSYIPNPEGKATVNHKDGDKMNNCVDNLEWATHRENSIHSIRILGNPKPPTYKGKFGAQHNRSIPVHMYDGGGNHIATFEGLSDAARKTGMSLSSVFMSLKHRSPAFSFYFFYEKEFKPDTTVRRNGMRKASIAKMSEYLKCQIDKP
jgi:hypothetical protein